MKGGKSVLIAGLILITASVIILSFVSSDSDSSDSSSSSGSSSSRTIIREREIIRLVPQDEAEDKEEESEGTISLGKPGITGATIGTLLSGSSLILIITMLCITFIIFLIVTSRTILKIKTSSSRKT